MLHACSVMPLRQHPPIVNTAPQRRPAPNAGAERKDSVGDVTEGKKKHNLSLFVSSTLPGRCDRARVYYAEISISKTPGTISFCDRVEKGSVQLRKVF